MENQNVTDSTQPSIASELAAIPYEPLLPVEKKLIAFSLILGILLLGLLLWISATYFPVASQSLSPGTQTQTTPVGRAGKS